MKDSLQPDKSKVYWDIFTTVFIYTTCSVVLLTATIFIGKYWIFSSGSTNKSSYPTSIPWIKSKLECEDTGRSWNNDKCWDEEHSASF